MPAKWIELLHCEVILLSFTLFIIGFVALIKGADFLVDGASAIARRLHVSDLVIGLTVVAFGTSTPQLFVNIVASLKGSTDIAIGNGEIESSPKRSDGLVLLGFFVIFLYYSYGIAQGTEGLTAHAPATGYSIARSLAYIGLGLIGLVTGGKRSLDRWESFVFVGWYIGYVVFLILPFFGGC
jgi:Ca2+/Na+ antiporter